ncbi:hypothetical protein CYMTET_35380 [Cymbomonas tetramitiformis]|uniref:Uncharacterized protein n=1 Tax=Cymbomonas tetramitiformis TaxID=36881 RepID=A0AAE0KNY4_9CHLO|nr:hypothetical protein CYMTET_35380 [Cymbomonas tetramitiformis]
MIVRNNRESGIRLQVPQLTIATATVFTHILFCHQSHAHHDHKHKVAAAEKGSVGSRERLVLIAERTILHTLNYNFEVEHPYKYLLTTIPKASPKVAANCELTQIAWNLVNDRISERHPNNFLAGLDVSSLREHQKGFIEKISV